MPAQQTMDSIESTVVPTSRDYGVILAQGDARRFETIVAASRDRAADMCEMRLNSGPEAPDPPWRAIAVTISDRFDVAGRCSRCRMVLFRDESPVETPAGVVCADGCRGG